MLMVGSPKRSLLFDRWPRLASRHPWKVLGGTLIAITAFAILFAVGGGTYGGASFSLPGTESQRLVDLLEERFPSTAGDSATVVVRAPAGINDPEVASRIETLLSDLGDLPDVVSVTSPNETPSAVSEDGTIARSVSSTPNSQAISTGPVLTRCSTWSMSDHRGTSLLRREEKL